MAVATLSCGVVVGFGACRKAAGPGRELPNIVVITLDTLRADRLGHYGYFRETSPSLDEFATESLVFERCLAPMATTLPTHISLFPGRPARLLRILSLR